MPSHSQSFHLLSPPLSQPLPRHRFSKRIYKREGKKEYLFSQLCLSDQVKWVPPGGISKPSSLGGLSWPSSSGSAMGREPRDTATSSKSRTRPSTTASILKALTDSSASCPEGCHFLTRDLQGSTTASAWRPGAERIPPLHRREETM